jgi:WD40 repeat protein
MTRSLTAHRDDVDRLAFSPNGELFATASTAGSAKLWDVGSAEQLAAFETPSHCREVAFAPDGQVLAYAFGDNAVLVDVKSREPLHLLEGHLNTLDCLDFSPDSRWLVTGSHDRTLRIWDVQTGKTRHVVAAHRDKISTLAVSPDGRTIASGDFQGTVAFSHVETGQFLFATDLGIQPIVRMRFSPDGETLAVALGGERVVLLRAPPIVASSNGPPKTDDDKADG